MIAEKQTPNPKEKGKEGAEETQTPIPPKEGTEGGKEPPKKKTEGGEQLPPAPVDYKKKFADSSREVQRITKESKQDKTRITELEVKLAEKANITPSDEELSQKYPDWSFLDEGEKVKLRETESLQKRLRVLEEDKAWDRDYKSLIKQSEFSSLKNQEEKFKEFAYKNPEIKNLKILAQSFLFENKAPEEPEKPPVRPGLEKPTAGREVLPSKMSLADIKNLRINDPKRYAKLLKEGKLKDIPTQ